MVLLCLLNYMRNYSLPICIEMNCERGSFHLHHNYLIFFFLFIARSKARFLWKRIPPTIKNGNVELEKIWNIFNHLWDNDVSTFFKVIDYEWSTNVAQLMSQLKGKRFVDVITLNSLIDLLIFL